MYTLHMTYIYSLHIWVDSSTLYEIFLSPLLYLIRLSYNLTDDVIFLQPDIHDIGEERSTV